LTVSWLTAIILAPSSIKEACSLSWIFIWRWDRFGREGGCGDLEEIDSETFCFRLQTLLPWLVPERYVRKALIKEDIDCLKVSPMVRVPLNH
jgi:hypothetical protein